VLKTPAEVRSWSRKCRAEGLKVGLVPTMGYLHDGHLSLVRTAAEHSDRIVVSVYVNESQFAPGEDLAIYPRDTEGDLAKLDGLCDVVFMPECLYEKNAEGTLENQTFVQVEKLQKPLCGVSRPIFFRGVATVVAKLFNIADPDVAVFGKKDYQQWRVITQMVKDLDFAVEVVGLPLVREADGLAMSSRNVRLAPDERLSALAIYKGLSAVKAAVREGERSAAALRGIIETGIVAAGGGVDYVEIVDAVTLEAVTQVTSPTVVAIAAKFGTVRLIDNVEIAP